MKPCILLLCTGLLCACGTVKQAPHFQDTSAAVGRAQSHTERTISHVQQAQESTKRAQTSAAAASAKINKLEQVVANQKDALDLVLQTKQDVDALTKELSTTQDSLTQAYTELGTVKGELGTAQYTIQQHEKDMQRVDATLAKAAVTEKKYHKLKWGVIAIITGILGYFVWRLKALWLPLGWPGVGLVAGIPSLVIAFLMFKL